MIGEIMKQDIRLTIFCLTYNHKQFIKDAVESFLAQQTTFKTRILIFDDLSTDGTTEILREYQKKYPEQIKLVVAPYNTYNHPDREKILGEVYEKYLAGEYVAWCEGDDFWTDPYKLQKQVDFMDNNPDCMMTTHAFTVIDYSNEEKYKKKSFGNANRYISAEEIITKPDGNLATASLVMRKKIFLRDDKYPKTDVGDFPLQLYAIVYGTVFYFSEDMCSYRYMHKGSWSKTNNDNYIKRYEHSLGFARFLIKYNTYSKNKFENYIWDIIKDYLYTAIEALLSVNNEQQTRIVKSLERKKDFLYTEFLRVYNIMHASDYVISDEIKKQLDTREIAILGAGKYSNYLVTIFENNDIKYEGCFITHKDEKYADIPTLDEFLLCKDDPEVYVGISQRQEKEIVEYIRQKNLKKVVYPLWFDKKLLLRDE